MTVSPFIAWDAKKAKEALDGRGIPTDYGRMFRGDHWLDGDGWVGPLPQSDSTASQITDFLFTNIERSFVSRNAIKEVVERGAGGVTGRAVAWDLVPKRIMGVDEKPTDQEQALIAEAKSLLAEWIKESNAHNILREATQTMLWAGRGPIRIFVPAGELEDGQVPRGDMVESLARIHLHEELDPEQIGVVRDQRTQKEAAIHVYTDDDDNEFVEIAYTDGENTVLRVMRESGDDKGQGAGPDASLGEWVLPLGGRLPIFEMRRKPLITDQIISQQKMLNLALTMMQHNVVMAGFLERILLNAQVPGHYETAEDGTQRFVADPLHVGAGTTNSLIGVITVDADGNEKLAQPSVSYRDPVPVQTFRDTREEAYMGILGETHQLHYAIQGDSTPSGVSRITAMADYVVDLLMTKAQVERAWCWMLETALTMASVFAGTPGRYDGLRVSSQAHVDPGPISPEMMTVIYQLAQGDTPLLSQATGIGWIGVDDIESEQARIRDEIVDRTMRRMELLREQQKINAEIGRFGSFQDGSNEDNPQDSGFQDGGNNQERDFDEQRTTGQ